MFVFDIFNTDNVMSQLTRTGNGEHNGISAGHNHDKGSDGRTDTRNSSSLFIFFLSVFVFPFLSLSLSPLNSCTTVTREESVSL